MKASLAGELLLLSGLLALAYLVYLQQSQLADLELELDRMRGSVGATLPPVPVASDNGEVAAPVPPVQAPKPRPRRQRKAAPDA